MRRIGVVTVSRSDYGLLRPVLKALEQSAELNFLLYVSGMHLSPEFGLTEREITADGFPVSSRVEMLLSSDTPEGISKSMGLGCMGFAQVYARDMPDILLVLGDRFEMHAAAIAAVPFNIPIAHIHGGELTFGAIDDSLRHSITKISHLHFTATEEYSDRVIQMGEEPWRVTVTGAPGLDNLATFRRISPEGMRERFGLVLSDRPILVTYHPATREAGSTKSQVRELFAALSQFEFPLVFTLPNADTEGRLVIQMVRKYVSENANAHLVENLGTDGYFTLLEYARAMVGNSSSGLIEAPSFGLPVVNIGTRQQGRVRASNVIDVSGGADAIADAIRTAMDTSFRDQLSGMKNPYGDGSASTIIARILENEPLGQKLLVKRFHSLIDNEESE